jgi:hypothetical protein
VQEIDLSKLESEEEKPVVGKLNSNCEPAGTAVEGERVRFKVETSPSF